VHKVPQNLGATKYQKVGMKQVGFWGPTDIRCHLQNLVTKVTWHLGSAHTCL